MPPAAAAKCTRASVYATSNKKRSVSPSAAPPQTSKSKSVMNTNPRRFEDSPFHEDAYREEILEYMQNMDVRLLSLSSGRD